MSLFLADTNEIVSNKKHAVPTAVHTRVYPGAYQGVSRASTSVSWLNIGVDTAQLWA